MLPITQNSKAIPKTQKSPKTQNLPRNLLLHTHIQRYTLKQLLAFSIHEISSSLIGCKKSSLILISISNKSVDAIMFFGKFLFAALPSIKREVQSTELLSYHIRLLYVWGKIPYLVLLNLFRSYMCGIILQLLF